jgi:uncharacterized protein with FMN-binding domain
MIKKVLLTVFVLATFVVYSIQQRNSNNVSTVKVSSVAKPSGQTSSSTATPTTTTYANGIYTGKAADAYYGYIQVKATIAGNKLTDVEFLQSPNDRGTSVSINSQAMPMLKQQALQVQSAQVDGVSGATDSSQAFIQSLSDALQQAKA